MSEERGFSQHLGRRFGMLAAALGLGVLYLFFAESLQTQRNPNAEPLLRGDGAQREVVLQQNRRGHYLADGSINGQRVTFMLDTGATTIAVPLQLANELDLERGASIQVNTANGIADAWLTRLDEVELGGLRLIDVRATISPGYDSDEILLGMNFLSKFDFSQRGSELILRQPGSY